MHIEPYGFLKGMPIVRLGGIANLEWAVWGQGRKEEVKGWDFVDIFESW
jgi:hypothetical protein